jgi:hypothetical protein
MQHRTGQGLGDEASPAPGQGGYVSYQREPQDPAERQREGHHQHPQDLHHRTFSARQGSTSCACMRAKKRRGAAVERCIWEQPTLAAISYWSRS